MKQLIFLLIVPAISIFSQHLPLQLGNQWHYNQGLGLTIPNAAIASDTVRINGILYYEIEYLEANTGVVYDTTYDRIEGDSLYFRNYNETDEMLFNFNWEDGQVIVTPDEQDTTCYSIMIINRMPTTVWGIQTDYYSPNVGFFCTGMEDTAWVLSSFSYLKYFGALDTQDGYLIGAVIDGVTYGTLHPLPVELLAFSASVDGQNVILNWETATEENNRGFEIERREPSGFWQTAAFIKGNGTTTQKHTYMYTDAGMKPGQYSYRLKQIDFDGSYEYSQEIKIEVAAPKKFSLEQNYPNPFNPATTINYQLPQAGFVTLKVYDVLGNEVVLLVNEQQNSGSYSVDFDASKLASGVYIYQLRVNEYLSSRKMLLLK